MIGTKAKAVCCSNIRIVYSAVWRTTRLTENVPIVDLLPPTSFSAVGHNLRLLLVWLRMLLRLILNGLSLLLTARTPLKSAS
jgi:hypothetical protein